MVESRSKLRSILFVAALVLAALPMGSAQADEPDGEATAQALELADQYMQDGDHAEAAALLKASYQQHPDPALLFKLAAAYEAQQGLPAVEGAIDAYRRYLEQAKPDAETEALVVERVAQLEERREALQKDEREAKQRRLDEAAARAAEGPLFIHGPWPWVIAGFGVASLAATGVFGVLSIVEHDGAVDEPVQFDAAERQSSAETFAIVANATLVAGILLTATGGTFIGLGIALPPEDGAAEDGAAEDGAELRFGPGGVSYRMRF